MRIALGIEYDGTAYNGWQRQRTGNGVQALVERALTAVANEAIEVTCAGRTDAGVHASGQVIHFDSSSERGDRGWLLGANSNLPDDVNVGWARHVDDAFHARYSAIARTYRYLILNRPARSALYSRRAWWVHLPVDEQKMHSAAQTLLGRHDFSAFRAAGCQASSPVRVIRRISITRRADWIMLEVTADAFLQRMVRNIIGTLLAIGCGHESPEWLGEVLASGDRKRGGTAAPPHGLTLISVAYPPEFDLPANRNAILCVPDYYFG